MFQTWADAFQGIPELKEVNKVYQELRHKGIEFPATDLDSMAPIHTPARVSVITELLENWLQCSVCEISKRCYSNDSLCT